MLIVVDTNVLVSALWSKTGAPAKIISLVLQGKLIPCYDYRILSEYRTVLARPKFGFTDGEINALLDWIEVYGRSILAEPLEDIFIDDSDKKFYEVAKCSNAILVTGNLKHFPNDAKIMSVSDFLVKYHGIV